MTEQIISTDQNISGLIKRFFDLIIEGHADRFRESRQLWEGIYHMCLKRKIAAGAELEDFASEVVCDIYDWLRESAENDESFLKVYRYTDDIDKRIMGYLFSIIRTKRNGLYDVEFKKEHTLIYEAVSDICNDLAKENFLVKTNGSVYHLFSDSEKETFKGKFNSYYISIRNKNGTINHGKLKDLVKNVFKNYLDNYKVELSNLVDIIESITNFGLDSRVYVDSEYNNENETTVSVIPESPDYHLILEEKAEGYFNDWKNKLLIEYQDEEELKQDIKFAYDKYLSELTLREIAEKNGSKLNHNSVNNHIKIFMKICGMHEELDPDDPCQTYFDLFLEHLKKEYKL